MRGLNTIFKTCSLRVICIVLFCSGIQPVLADQAVTLKTTPFKTAVVELYTSEGCSSCPPAEQWLHQLIKIPQDELDTLVLEFHVDYWDYIGWKDPFANKDYTTRQRQLVRLNRQNSVYTPEFFVNGVEARGTNNVLKKIRESNTVRTPVQLELSVSTRNSDLQLYLLSQLPADQPLEVNFVIFENHLSSVITRGENEGSTLKHHRVVRLFSPALPAQQEMTYTVPLRPDWVQQNLGIGVLLSNRDGEYIQAVSALLNPDS